VGRVVVAIRYSRVIELMRCEWAGEWIDPSSTPQLRPRGFNPGPLEGSSCREEGKGKKARGPAQRLGECGCAGERGEQKRVRTRRDARSMCVWQRDERTFHVRLSSLTILIMVSLYRFNDKLRHRRCPNMPMRWVWWGGWVGGDEVVWVSTRAWQVCVFEQS
jgi:hypothetical protein